MNKFYVTPSPNELEALLQQQTLFRRQQRLQQVRQQGHFIAKSIRDNVDRKRRRALQDLASELNKQFATKQQQQVVAVKNDYTKGLESVGCAHSCAANTDTDQALFEARFEQKKVIAKQRYCDAIKQLKIIKSLEEKENLEMINRRKLVTHKENIRAKRIAMMPKPEKTSEDASTTTGTETTKSLSTTRSTSQSSMIFVERATKTERNAYDDAKAAALTEQERYDDSEAAKIDNEIARRERAKFRHIAALRQTRMQNEYRDLENDLKYLQKKDARKRREAIPSIPLVPALDVSLQDLML